MVEIKKQIKHNFSKAVNDYNKWALVQKLAAEKLSMLLPRQGYAQVLDVGCGTGFLVEELKKQKVVLDHITGIDVAQGMIEHCKKKWQEHCFLHEDAEHFTTEQKYDLIISNFTFQWFDNIPLRIFKYLDMLKKGGILALSFPVKGSLKELYEASLCRNKKPLNLLGFPDFVEILQKIHQTRSETVLNRLIEPMRIFYNSPKETIKAIKKIGAGFLEGKAYSIKEMKNLLFSYETMFKNKKGLYPLTYNVGFLVIKNQK